MQTSSQLFFFLKRQIMLKDSFFLPVKRLSMDIFCIFVEIFGEAKRLRTQINALLSDFPLKYGNKNT